MFVLKIILFIAALLFFFIAITFFSSSDEGIGTPFIILGAAALAVAILLCFKLYLASKITLAAEAGLLLLLGIGNMGDSEETAGWFCIIAAAILALLSFAWFMNWIGGTKRTDANAAVTRAQESTLKSRSVETSADRRMRMLRRKRTGTETTRILTSRFPNQKNEGRVGVREFYEKIVEPVVGSITGQGQEFAIQFAEKLKNGKVPAVDIYNVAGMKVYSLSTEDDRKRISSWCDEWTKEAQKLGNKEQEKRTRQSQSTRISQRRSLSWNSNGSKSFT